MKFKALRALFSPSPRNPIFSSDNIVLLAGLLSSVCSYVSFMCKVYVCLYGVLPKDIKNRYMQKTSFVFQSYSTKLRHVQLKLARYSENKPFMYLLMHCVEYLQK